MENKIEKPSPVIKLENNKFQFLSIIKNNLLPIGIGITTFIIIAVSLMLYDISKKETEYKNTAIFYPTPTIYIKPPGQVYKQNYIVIKRQTLKGEEEIYSAYAGSDHPLAYWQNYFFWGTAGYGKDVELSIHNTGTGETNKLIIEKNTKRYISDIKVIDDNLFFSSGGYLRGGNTYWIKLPPSDNFEKISEGANGRITKMNNQYWLINGEGDACWNGSSYSTLDPISKKVTHIIDSAVGCFGGDEFLGIDKNNRMILANHDKSSENNDDWQIYKYVIAVPIANPEIKEGVIARQNMPENIDSIEYLDSKNQLLLKNKQDSFIYDFTTDKLSKIPESEITPLATPTPIKEKSFEEKIKEMNLPPEYKIVIEERTY